MGSALSVQCGALPATGNFDLSDLSDLPDLPDLSDLSDLADQLAAAERREDGSEMIGAPPLKSERLQ